MVAVTQCTAIHDRVVSNTGEVVELVVDIVGIVWGKRGFSVAFPSLDLKT